MHGLMREGWSSANSSCQSSRLRRNVSRVRLLICPLLYRKFLYEIKNHLTRGIEDVPIILHFIAELEYRAQ